MVISREKKGFLKKFVPAAALIGGLCCLTPIVLVFFGLSSVAYAASLSDTLYYGYAWAFRLVALGFLLLGLFWYFYKKEKVCSVSEFKKRRREIINFILFVLLIAVIAYILWLYVILELVGKVLGIWN